MSGLFAKDTPPALQQTPTPTPPPPMPDPLSPAALEARRSAQVKQTMGGRQSSILTTTGTRGAGAGGTLAGGAYAGSKAGG